MSFDYNFFLTVFFRFGKDDEAIRAFLEDSEVEGFSSDDDVYDKTWSHDQAPGRIVPESSSSDEEEEKLQDSVESVADITVTKSQFPPPLHVDIPGTESQSKQARKYLWKESSFLSKNIPSYNINKQPVLTPLEYFSQYFTDELFELGAKFSNMYCLAKTGSLLNTTPFELKMLFGIHGYIGAIHYPRLHMYWKQGMDLGLVSKVMP